MKVVMLQKKTVMELKDFSTILSRLKSNGVGFIDLLFKSSGCLTKKFLSVATKLEDGPGYYKPPQRKIEFNFSDGIICLGKVYIHTDDLSAKGFDGHDTPEEVFSERLNGAIGDEKITLDFSFSEMYHQEHCSIGKCRIVYYP